MNVVSLGQGVIARRLAPWLEINPGAKIRWFRSDTDVTGGEGRRAVMQAVRSDGLVLVGIRPQPEDDPVAFYAAAGLCATDLAQAGCPVVLLSSSAVYGSNLCAQEGDAGRPATRYGLGKWTEESLYRICPRLLILRIFDTYGEDRHGVLSVFKFHARVGTIPTVSPTHMDFLHLDDVAFLISYIVQSWLRQGAKGQHVVNVGSGKSVYLPALWESLGERLTKLHPGSRPSCVASVAHLLDWVPLEVFSPLRNRDLRTYLLW